MKGFSFPMNYDISVIYGFRTPDAPDYPFSAQTLSADRIQFLPVAEDDIYCPHKNSLQALSRAEGRFTILLDNGDVLPNDFFEKMLSGAEQESAAFSMSFTRYPISPASEERFNVASAKDALVHTNHTPAVFPVSLYGLLVPTDALRKAYEKAAALAEPEKQTILLLLKKKHSFFYSSCVLQCAVPRECDIMFSPLTLVRDWYFKPFEEFLLPTLEKEKQKNGSVSLLLQFLALHMYHMRLFANSNNRNKYVISREEAPSYMEFLSRVLQYVDVSSILLRNSRPAASNLKNRLFDLRVKKLDYAYYPDLLCERGSVRLFVQDNDCSISFCTLKDMPARVNLIDYKNGHLEIDGGIEDFFSTDRASVYAKFDGHYYPVVYNQRYSMTKCFGVTYSRMKTFHVSIPIEDSTKDRLLNFVFVTNDMEYTMEYSFPSHTSRFAKDFNYGYWTFGNYLSFWNKHGIHIRPASKLQILKKEGMLWIQMWKKRKKGYHKQIPLKVLNFLLRPYFSRQRIWLFFDKIYKGGDSSEYIYRYAAAQKDGIKKYYLLDKSSEDYKRMKAEGYKPLVRGSLKHRLVFLNANMVIASNSTVFAFNDYTSARCLPIRGNVHFDVACVQHGMSVQKIALAQQRLRDNTKLYFCASKYEIENLSKPVYDYDGYDALKLTGVPRYDGLKDRKEKIILLSPTWRMNSAMPVTANEGVARSYNPNFKETSYYEVYNNLINDPRLLESAKKYGYRIQYVLHPIVSPQSEDFTKNDFVEIIPSIGNMSYEKLFCEAALMVSDFSGVQFDFAYMRKPVVYLHHNDIPQHYEEGTFHYDTMGFGEICHTNDELIDVLIQYMANDCEMPEIYRKRADDFFYYSDNNNCARIYPIMLEHEMNREF